MAKSYPVDEVSEKTILGIALLDSKDCSNILITLDEDDFYAENRKNSYIFKAMKAVFDSGRSVDVVTVTSQLELMKELDKVGGVDYLMSLCDLVTTFQNLDFYITNLRDVTLLRKFLIEIDEIRKTYDTKEIPDINDFIGDAEKRLSKITENRRVSDFISAKEAARIVGEKIQTAYGVENSISGISTGFRGLDSLINGLGKGELIILAARPSVGKSALALNIGFNAAKLSGKPVAIFSLEMSYDVILKRLFASLSMINFELIQKGILTTKQRNVLKEVERDISNVNLFIDDSSASTIEEIVLKCKKLKESKGDLGLIVVDYIGLINDKNNIFRDNEQAKVASFSRRLKTLALELDCPILCLAQLNRKTEERDSKKPQISDLRSSGAIENDADKVMFIYRPAYYEDQGISLSPQKNKYKKNDDEAKAPAPINPVNPMQENQNKNDEKKTDVVEILVAKNRNGRIGSCSLFFMKSYGRFFSPDEKTQREISNYSD